MNYFTADLHFADENTLVTGNRPFKNIKEYDKFMIKQINKTAKKDDTVFVIGDFFDCDSKYNTCYLEASKYIKKIKAKLFLIIGNNEKRIIKHFFNNNYEKFREYCLSLGFVDVQKSLRLDFGGREFYLVHEPKDTKSQFINLFGHIHDGGAYRSYGVNVGVDANHFRLWDEADILYFVYLKEKYMNNDVNINMN